MPQNYQAGEFNSFVGGLVTEASPLTFPENASIDEVNFVLDRNGSRRRRLGINLEPGTTTVPRPGIAPTATEYTTTYSWKNPGGLGGKSLVVLQTDNNITFIDRSAASSGDWRFQAFELVPDNEAPDEILASYAPIDGRLVVAYGGQEVAVFDYDTVSGTVSKGDSTKIKIRDLFGIAVTIGGVKLWEKDGIAYRPLDGEGTYDMQRYHLYNLRNQGWMRPRARWYGSSGASFPNSTAYKTLEDPIKDFLDPNSIISYGRLPSMGDSVTPHLYPNVEVTDKLLKDLQRFDANSANSAQANSTRAPAGSFVIDLFDRRKGRMEGLLAAYENYKTAQGEGEPYIRFKASGALAGAPEDRSTGGVRATAEFAGRVWYGGFDGPLEGGDELSPNLSSYVAYSQQVKDFSDIGKCYQEADPTDPDDPERVATDGGFIRISGCSNIKAMVNIGSKLIVLSESGIWAIGGTSNGQFDANNQEITKISEYGVLSPRSIALVEGTLAYWSEDGIYQVLSDEIGNLKVQELSVNISSLYQSIPYSQKETARSIYDSYDKKIKWVYDTDLVNGGFKELIFDLKLSAFYRAEYGGLQTAARPILLGPVEIPPYNLAESTTQVLGGDDGLGGGGQYNVVANVTTPGSYIYPPLDYNFSAYGGSEYTQLDAISVYKNTGINHNTLYALNGGAGLSVGEHYFEFKVNASNSTNKTSWHLFISPDSVADESTGDYWSLTGEGFLEDYIGVPEYSRDYDVEGSGVGTGVSDTYSVLFNFGTGAYQVWNNGVLKLSAQTGSASSYKIGIKTISNGLSDPASLNWGQDLDNFPFEYPNLVPGSVGVTTTENVVASTPISTYGTAETAYLVWDTYAGRLSFATVSDNSFRDWTAYDGTGVDSEAYLVTGYIGTGDFARYKQVPYITFHFNRTESGFLDDGNDLKVIGESSCIVQSQWDWTNTAASNKWGKPFQAYRYKRPYMPSGAGDSYDTGRETIVTKNKLRGRGRVLSLKISSEPEKDLQLLGWSMIIGANGNV